MKQFARAAQQDGQVRRQAIAVLSDGEDTSSVIGFRRCAGAGAEERHQYLHDLPAEPVFGGARRESAGKYFSESDFAMKSLAQETGALSYFPQSVQELKGIYAGISDELSNQYSIGYSPTNWRADGRFRRIVVRVNAHPEFRPRARMGYTADAVRSTQSLPAPQR